MVALAVVAGRGANMAETQTLPVITNAAVEQETLPLQADPLGDYSSVLQQNEDDRVFIDNGMAAGVADIYNMAGVGSLHKAVNANDVVERFQSNGEATGSDIDYLLSSIREEDSGVQKEMITAAISNPQVGVEQRVALANEINGLGSIPDMNMILRQGMHNANVLSNTGDTDEEVEDYEWGAQVAESEPTNVTLSTPMPTTQEDARAYFTRTLNEVYTQADEQAGGGDFLASMIPFRYQVPVMRIYNAMGLDEGDVTAPSGHLLMGNALESIRQHVEGMDYEQKREALDTVLRVLKPNGGVFQDGNDLVTMHTLEEIFYKDLFQEDYDSPGIFSQAVGNLLPFGQKKVAKASAAKGTAILDNFGSLLDLVGLGQLARGTIRLGTKWLPSSLSKLRKVSPEMAAKTAADSLDDELVRAKFPGMTKEDVVASFLPSADRALQEGGVEGMGELVSRQLDIRDRLLRISERSNLSAAERADAFTEIQKVYGDVAARPASTLHVNESVFTAGETSARVEAIFGRTKSKPFTTLRSATKAKGDEIRQVFGADAVPDVVWRNPATGKLEDVPKGMAASTKGEFFLRAVDERAYESAPTAYHSLVLGDKDVANLRFAPSVWKALRGPTIMGRDIGDLLSLAPRQRTEWNKLTAGLTSEIAGLSGKDSSMLSKVLKDGEKVSATTGKGKIFTPSELKDMGMSQAAQRAYYSYRTATDIMYEVVNRQTRTRMFREGVKDVHGPKGRVGFAQLRQNADAIADINPRSNSLAVFDAMKGEFIQLDRSAIDRIYKSGGKLARLEQPMLGKGAKEATHVIVDEGSGVRALGLPRQVVTKVDGYYPHMWNGNYVVYGTTAAGNRFALGLASNEADAKRVVERMQKVNARRAASGKSSRFGEISYDFDRQLSQDLARRGGIQEGLYTNMGGPVYGHRNGGDLRNFSKAAGDIQVDPIEALLRGMEIVGTKTTKGELATYMRQKLYTYAKQEGVLKNPAVIPASADDLVKTAAKSLQYNKAKAYMDSIDNMLNMEDAVDATVSKFFLEASGIVSRLAGGTEAGRAVASRLATQAARGGDPMSSLMGLLHRTTIASAPIGQGALQASQSLVMLGVSPTNYLKAVRQTGVITMLIGMRTSALHGGSLIPLTSKQFKQEAKLIAATAGMTEDEVVKVVDTILESGIVSSVGYHAQMRNAIRSAAEERALANAKGLNRAGLGAVFGRFARAADAATFGTLSRVGFEAGESLNQIATFLTLYNRDKAKGIADLASSDYVRRLVGSVAELTGNMIPEAGFTYQRGWFKAAMQFVSFQHKMMLLMLPQALGGAKTITAKEKAGMIFAQFLLFGRRGAPHMDAIYRVVDSKIREQAADEGEMNELYAAWNDPTTRAVMDGLVFDTAGNYVLKELFQEGEGPDYALSERFAPGGGSEFAMDRLFAIASNPTQALFGLSGEKVSKLYSFSKRVGDVTFANIRGYDDVPLDDRFEELGKEGATHLFSSYNRYLATKAAERMDGWVSSGGRLTEGFAGDLEGDLYKHFGITTKDRESLYAAMDKYQEEKLTNPLSRQKDLDELVDQYYRDLVLTAVRLDKEATEDDAFNTMMDKWTRERGMLFSVLPEPDAEYIRDAVSQRIEKAAQGQADSAETVLIERLSKDIRDGRFGQDGPDVALYLNQSEFVKNNPKLKEMIMQAWTEATTDDYLENK